MLSYISLLSFSFNCRITDGLWNIKSALYLYSTPALSDSNTDYQHFAKLWTLAAINMKESEFVKGLYKVDLGLTILFWEVYGGDEFYPLRENATLKDYKTHFSKLITTIKQTFLDTCVSTDNEHKDEIISLTTSQLNSIRNIKTIENLFTDLVIFFPKLCFLLIGKRPNNFSNRIKDNRSSWTMNQHRQIQYTQSREHQFQCLRDKLKDESVEGLSSYKKELKNYQAQRLKGEDMLDWFKRLYPEKYFKLFDRVT